MGFRWGIGRRDILKRFIIFIVVIIRNKVEGRRGLISQWVIPTARCVYVLIRSWNPRFMGVERQPLLFGLSLQVIEYPTIIISYTRRNGFGHGG
jgi:hypothetical protein